MKSASSSILLRCVILTCFFHSCITYRILALFTAPFYSHFIPAIPILQKLLERGHELVIVSGYSFSVNETWKGNASFIEVQELRGIADHTLEPGDLWGTVTLFEPLMYQYRWVSIENRKMEVLNSNANHILFGGKFDAIFTEDMGAPAFYPLADYYDCPYIGFSPSGQNPEGRLGNFQHMILHPTTDESEILFGHEGPKSFIDRFLCLVHDFMKVVQYSYKLRDKLKGSRTLLYGSLISGNIKKRTSADVHLQAVHPALGFQRPMAQKTIQIGFPHIRSTQPLPIELQNYLTASQNGVIYVSFGSIINSKIASNPAVFNMTALQRALARVKFDVIWKWDDAVMKDMPINVKLQKWVPQQDLIAHEKVILVICHGGLQTIAESIYHAKPSLNIPFLWDHQPNSERVRDLGVGKLIQRNEMIEDEIVNTILDLVYNQSYKSALKELSAVIKDTPISPIEVAVNEIESTVRLKGDRYHVPTLVSWFPETEPGHLELGLTVIFPALFVILGSLIFLGYMLGIHLIVIKHLKLD